MYFAAVNKKKEHRQECYNTSNIILFWLNINVILIYYLQYTEWKKILIYKFYNSAKWVLIRCNFNILLSEQKWVLRNTCES